MSNEIVLDFGYGCLEVMQGAYKDKYSLIIGKNGNGIIGETISKDRYLNPDEVLTVFTFSNVASIDVVINQLNQLKYNMENKLPYYVKNEYGEIIQTIKPKLD
jgi:hypothetical protein